MGGYVLLQLHLGMFPHRRVAERRNGAQALLLPFRRWRRDYPETFFAFDVQRLLVSGTVDYNGYRCDLATGRSAAGALRLVGREGQERQIVEVVATDMQMLDSRPQGSYGDEGGGGGGYRNERPAPQRQGGAANAAGASQSDDDTDMDVDDIPF